MLHGFSDNCGSFDRLLPLFPQNQQMIAIDIPGHGFSSHLGPNDSYHFEDLNYITTVAKYYNFDKFSLMGHSMGGRGALQFAAENSGMILILNYPYLYSECNLCILILKLFIIYIGCIERLIMLDCVMPFYKSIQFKEQKEMAEEAIKLKIREELKSGINSPPKYNYENAVKRMLNASENLHGYESITKEDAIILCQRGLRKVSEMDEWEFTRDFRIDVLPLQGHPKEKIVELASKIKCPHLIIRASRVSNYQQKVRLYPFYYT